MSTPPSPTVGLRHLPHMSLCSHERVNLHVLMSEGVCMYSVLIRVCEYAVYMNVREGVFDAHPTKGCARAPV